MATPKILQFSAATVRNQRTLIWLQEQSPAVSWWKWDGVVTSVEDYHRWSGHGAHLVGLVLTSVDSSETDTWLQDIYQISKKVQMILLSQDILSLKPQEYWTDNFDNLLNVDDLQESYPFLRTPWKGSNADDLKGSNADAIRMFALVCRYHRVVDIGVEETRPLYGLQQLEGAHPAELVVVSQFYRSSSKKRLQELRECLRRNLNCRWIDRLVLLNETDESALWASHPDKAKITQVILGKRLTYGDFLRYVSVSVPSNSVAVLANADIYFGDSLAEAWKINWTDRALALLRWDDTGSGPKGAKLFGPRSDAQDVWMFSSDAVKERTWKYTDFSFPLGHPGCDNAFLARLLPYRFVLSNPALSLTTYHLHNSQVRTYQKKDTIVSPFYVHLAPTYLVDTKQEFTPHEAPAHHLCHEMVSFEIKSSSMSNEITYCTMLEKAGRYQWEPMVENFFFEPAIPVYRWKGGAGVTPNGLVYDLHRVYTGKHVARDEFNYWKGSTLDIFTPQQKTYHMAAIPFANTEVFHSWNTYVLYYLSRYLRLLSLYPSIHFWLPPSYQDRLTEWKGVSVERGVPFSEETPCWAEEVIGFLPSPAVSELGREEIEALRAACPSWKASADNTLRCVVTKKEWVPLVRKVLPMEWSVEVGLGAEEMVGASLCVVEGGLKTSSAWASLWALPKGARVLEFQQEMAVDGQCQHLCHVADLLSCVFLLSRGSAAAIQEQVETDLTRWLRKQ